MKKTMVRVLAWMLSAMLLAAPAALADLARGDRGEDVAELQRLLFETGWLFELPDGVFGRNTEAAVKEFEEFAYLPVDGIADELMIHELSVSHAVLHEETGVESDAQELYPAEYGDTVEFAESCIQWTDGLGSSHIEYCEEHHAIQMETYQMLESGSAEAAKRASEMWYEEVGALYDRWAGMMSIEEKGSVLANRAAFLASVEAQRMIPATGERTESQTVRTEAGVCNSLRNQAVWLCNMIWQMENGAEAGAAGEAVALNASVLIDGDILYYAGDPAGQGTGIYVMENPAEGWRRISDISATIEAASNGNLLVCDSDGSLEVLRKDGTLETVAYGSNGHAIAHDGRFYYGGSSVSEVGYDHQWLLSSSPEYHDFFWPIEVNDGYLYYLDTGSRGDMHCLEGSTIPADGTMSRLHLESGEIELISGAGTNYLGIENGTVYYTREDYRYFDESDGSMFTVEVDEGLFAANLDTLEETKIAGLADDDLIYEKYHAVENGVIYGERTDYSLDEDYFSIVRMGIDGVELPAVTLEGSNGLAAMRVADGVCYGVQSRYVDNGEVFVDREYILIIDMTTGGIREIAFEGDGSMFYSDLGPCMEIIGGDIYCCQMNILDGSDSLQRIDAVSGEAETLVNGAPLY